MRPMFIVLILCSSALAAAMGADGGSDSARMPKSAPPDQLLPPLPATPAVEYLFDAVLPGERHPVALPIRRTTRISRPSYELPLAEGESQNPAPDKIEHLIRAAEHLEAAGLQVQAYEVGRQLRLEYGAILAEKLGDLDDMQREVDRLRKLAGMPAMVQVSVHAIELDRSKLSSALRKKLSPDRPTQKMPTAHRVIARKTAARLLKELIDGRCGKILAEPSLVTLSGKAAHITSGGEFPVPVPSPDGLTAEPREFGVRLEVVPRVLPSSRVHVELTLELSARDFSNRAEIGGQLISGLETRRVSTQVDCHLGETVIMSCMITRRPEEAGDDGSAPETEFLILVTTNSCDPNVEAEE